MTGTEILSEFIQIRQPAKSVLIVDLGHAWEVTMFGPDSAGLGTEHITVQSAMEAIEEAMINVRRQPDQMTRGIVISDPAQVAKELAGK